MLTALPILLAAFLSAIPKRDKLWYNRAMVARGGQQRPHRRGYRPGRLTADFREPLAQAPRHHLTLSPKVPFEAESQLLPETQQDLHIHNSIEVGVLLSGQQERLFGDLRFQASPGDVWLVVMWEPHGWRVTQPDTRTVVVHFLPEFICAEMTDGVSWLSMFAVPPAQRPRVTGGGVRDRVLGVARELKQEIEGKQPGWAGVVRADLVRLLTILYRAWDVAEPPAGVAAGDARGLRQIMPALTALHATPGQRISLSQAAGSCGLSVRHFERVFAHTMGLPFQRLSLRVRLGHVQRLLATTDLPITAIAAETGFSDPSHLHRTFVKHFRSTPGDYRKRLQHL